MGVDMRLVDYAGQFLAENATDTVWDNIAVRHLVASLVTGIKENRTTIRDHFATAAMQGLLAGQQCSRALTANEAYRIADAMLEAREEVV